MHILIGTAALAAMVAFAFGETAARAFVGLALAALACFIVLIVVVTVVDNRREHVRQPAVYVAPPIKNSNVWATR